MCLIVYSNDHAPLTVRLIYSSSKLRTVQMMIFSLVAMIGLAKCCITSACLQWLCHSGERIVARGPLVRDYWRKLTQIYHQIPLLYKSSGQPNEDMTARSNLLSWIISVTSSFYLFHYERHAQLIHNSILIKVILCGSFSLDTEQWKE